MVTEEYQNANPWPNLEEIFTFVFQQKTIYILNANCVHQAKSKYPHSELLIRTSGSM